jgi:hypothetical protein
MGPYLRALHLLTMIVKAQCLNIQALRTRREVGAQNKWEEGVWFGVGACGACH